MKRGWGVSFPGGVIGIALNLEEDEVGCVILGDVSQLKQGDVLATADSSDAQVALLSAQATLAAAQSRLTNDQANSKTPSSTI